MDMNRHYALIAAQRAAIAASMVNIQADSGEEIRKVKTYDGPRREDFASRADYRRAVAKFKKGEVYW